MVKRKEKQVEMNNELSEAEKLIDIVKRNCASLETYEHNPEMFSQRLEKRDEAVEKLQDMSGKRFDDYNFNEEDFCNEARKAVEFKWEYIFNTTKFE
jgi:predicted DNA-binding protein YlxM (UPF0122 family)